jgi:hypothetical protein
MRSTTETIVRAFLAKRARTAGRNSKTNGHDLRLFDNVIAEWRGDGIWITTAGWNTATTRDRLQGLAREVTGRHVLSQRKGVLYFDGKPWDGGWRKLS